MTRYLRNSNWASGRPTPIPLCGPTGFEEEVQRLGLNERTCETSGELKQWCERNKDRRYIPESLFKRWGMSVDPILS